MDRILRLFAPALLAVTLTTPVLADDIVRQALAFAEQSRTEAAGRVAAARDRVAAADADLKLAWSVASEARAAQDRDAITVATEAIAVAQAGRREADALLTRANALLALRTTAADQVRIWLASEPRPRALVIPVEGEVRRLARDGSAITGEFSILKPGESIVTGHASRARVFVAGGEATVLVNEDTTFTVNKDDEASGFSGQLEKGFGRIRLWVKSKSGKFEVRTPASVTSVRGTDFSIRASAAGDRIQVFEGVVAVSPAASGDPVMVEAGQELEMSATDGLRKPKPFDRDAVAHPWRAEDAPR